MEKEQDKQGHISGDDVMLVPVKPKTKTTGSGYSADEIDRLLNTVPAQKGADNG